MDRFLNGITYRPYFLFLKICSSVFLIGCINNINKYSHLFGERAFINAVITECLLYTKYFSRLWKVAITTKSLPSENSYSSVKDNKLYSDK